MQQFSLGGIRDAGHRESMSMPPGSSCQALRELPVPVDYKLERDNYHDGFKRVLFHQGHRDRRV